MIGLSPPQRTRPLRLLLLDPIGGPGWGGVEKWMLAVANDLRARGHHVRAGAREGSRWSEACRDRGLQVTALGLRSDLAFRDLVTLRALYRREGIDLVVVKSHRCIRQAWSARVLAGGPGPAILCRVGDPRLRRSVSSRLTYLHLADAHVTPSRRAAETLVATGYFAPGRLHVVPNGVAVPPADPGVRARIRAELGLGEGPVLVTTSRLNRSKRHALLFEALAPLRATPGLRLLVLGDGRSLPELVRRARDRGLGDVAVFTGHREDVLDVLRAADLFVLPSRLEGMPNSLLEAMAAGLPVVATAVDGVPEVVRHGETGRLVPPDDVAALTDALGRLIADPAARRRLGRAGRARVQAEFGLETMLRRCREVLLATRDLRAPRARARVRMESVSGPIG